jgi:eukaryotic-like serine/threonine-protein kinase
VGSPRFGLSTRIFLASAGIVTVVLGITLFLTQRSAQQASQKSVAARLTTARDRVRELVVAERRELLNRLRGYAESPDFRSGVEQATDPDDYIDRAETAAEVVGAEWVQLIGRDGVRLAKSDDPSAPADTMLGSPLVTRALDGSSHEAFGVAGDSVLTHVVSVPIFGTNNRIIGALMAARFVSDSIVRAVGRFTSSDIFFYVLTRDDAMRVTASTDELRRVGEPVLVEIAQRIQDSWADTAAGVQQAGAVRDSLTQVEFGGEHYVGRAELLFTAQGNAVGGFVALRSLDRELREVGFTELRRTLLLSGGGGLLLALLVAGLTTRRIVRPVRLLATASRRAAEGDYQAEIPEGGSDEIGTLSSAFRRLLGDLRDKQALVDFLSASSGGAGATVSMSGTAATMKLAMAGTQMIAPGSRLGSRYEITSVLGVGGMGVVYKAHDRELGEPVAIKTLKPEMVAMDTSALERFKSEIRLARRIAHRNVVRTYDLGETNGLYYLTMEYVEGKSLKELIRARGRLPASAVLPIAKQLCRALEVAHDEGVIHRDVKPQNMVVQGDGVLKVMDFGIARLASRPADAGHTQAGMVVGTPEYMAPEQLAGDELDARADIYAAGCVLYECLTGTVPITADSVITLIGKVLEEVPVPPSQRYPDIPAELSSLVMWTLEKSRDERPASAAELHARLGEIAT